MGKYIVGLDPASITDYFGIVIHDLSSGMPKLAYIDRWRGTGFDSMLAQLRQQVFAKYPPFYIVTDYTNEKTFTDLLIKLYGRHKVEPVKYTVPNKKMLKDDGLSILRQGYKFPNPNIQKEPFRSLIKELVGELQREQLIITKSGKETFDHPPGKHNDLAAGWELSIHGCLRHMLKRGALQTATRKWGPEINKMMETGTKFPKQILSSETVFPYDNSQVYR